MAESPPPNKFTQLVETFGIKKTELTVNTSLFTEKEEHSDFKENLSRDFEKKRFMKETGIVLCKNQAKDTLLAQSE